MLEIMKKEESLQDGIPYIIETFSNGTKAKYIKPMKNEITEPDPIPPPPLTEQEQIAIDTALNVEYIACLMEANLG